MTDYGAMMSPEREKLSHALETMGYATITRPYDGLRYTLAVWDGFIKITRGPVTVTITTWDNALYLWPNGYNERRVQA